MRVQVDPAGSWAASVATALNEWLAARARPRLCLAAGATPEPVYRRLAPALVADATIFLLDEFGGLPAGDPGRCAAMLRRGLLDRAAVPAGRFRFPDVDVTDLDAECRRYEHAILDGGLDLAVLGLGTNGHVGMNEPGSDVDTVTRVVHLTDATRTASSSYGVSEPPTWGITMGMRTLLAAGEVWLLVTGRRKREVLDRVLNGPIDPAVPATLLRDHPHVVFHVDDEAYRQVDPDPADPDDAAGGAAAVAPR